MSHKGSSAQLKARERAWREQLATQRAQAAAVKREQDRVVRQRLAERGLHPVRLHTLEEELETIIYGRRDSGGLSLRGDTLHLGSPV